jgi:hypothetical protein
VLEKARFIYDETLREIEALKIARIGTAFPNASDAGRYILSRLLGDQSCLSCGTEGGPLINQWLAAVEHGACVVCGAAKAADEQVVPVEAFDAARLARAEERLTAARATLDTAEVDLQTAVGDFSSIQGETTRIRQALTQRRERLRELSGSLPPTPPELKALEERLLAAERTLKDMLEAQRSAEIEFAELFDGFRVAVEERAQTLRANFAERISDFLVEEAEITLEAEKAPLGESGQSYPWPVFRLSMTSGAFENPAARRTVNDVSMSQGEFIDLAFRLALAQAAASNDAVTLIFDAPEASLDALFMRRAGAFLSRFTDANSDHRLIVTSNLTNADMIPALFGAYVPEAGDPTPQAVPRSERSRRVIDLLSLAAPTRAVRLVGDRYRNLLDRALFPPHGSSETGL